MEINKNSKGMLLTLVTVVLVVLMITGVTTYIYLKIEYQTAASFSTVSSSGYNFVSTIRNSLPSILHTSLYAARGTLIDYEQARQLGISARICIMRFCPPTQNRTELINNTAYAFESLMTNGIIYNSENYGPQMSGLTLAYWTNAITAQGVQEGFNINLTNATLQVYQTNPYYINATYSATAIINSTSGIFAYPIVASSAIPINGSADLYNVQNGDGYKIMLTNQSIAATLVGNTYAIAGSTGPFQFIYGTAVVANAAVTCPRLPLKFNATSILITANDSAGSCGFGGVVTYVPVLNSAYTVPYLVYNSASNALGYINNGTSLLLNGNGLALLNISSLQNAVHSGYYYTSGFTPSYMDWAQNTNGANDRSQYGIYSFNLYKRFVPLFSSATIGYVNVTPTATASFAAYNNTGNFSISLWFNSAWQISNYTNGTMVQEQINNSLDSVPPIYQIAFVNQNLMFGAQTNFRFCSGNVTANSLSSIVMPNAWYNVVAVLNTSNGITNGTIYLDGIKIATSNTLQVCGGSVGNITIGAEQGGAFVGSIANLQIYNTSLSSEQAASLYYKGLDSSPTALLNLSGWWPLNGNLKDYSGFDNNGISNTPGSYNSLPDLFTSLYGYTGDPIYGGTFYNSYEGNLTNVMEGVYDCANINQCSNQSLQQLYLGQESLSSSQNGVETESNALGLANATIPNVALFNGNGYAISSVNNAIFNGVDNFTVSAWVYMTPSTSGPVMSIEGGCTTTPNSIYPVSGCATSMPLIAVTGGDEVFGYIPGIPDGASGLVHNSNQWYLLSVEYIAPDVMSLYIDGTPQIPGSIISGTYPNIGANAFWTTSCSGCGLGAHAALSTLNGEIGDVSIYNFNLTEAQQLQLYQNDSLLGSANVPTNLWPLSGGYQDFDNESAGFGSDPSTAILINSGTNTVCTSGNFITEPCGVAYTQP
jgi:hypothetical protein